MTCYYVVLTQDLAGMLVRRIGDTHAVHVGRGVVRISDAGLLAMKEIPKWESFGLAAGASTSHFVTWVDGHAHSIETDLRLIENQAMQVMSSLGMPGAPLPLATNGTVGEGTDAKPWWWTSTILAWAAGRGARIQQGTSERA